MSTIFMGKQPILSHYKVKNVAIFSIIKMKDDPLQYDEFKCHNLLMLLTCFRI